MEFTGKYMSNFVVGTAVDRPKNYIYQNSDSDIMLFRPTFHHPCSGVSRGGIRERVSKSRKFKWLVSGEGLCH